MLQYFNKQVGINILLLGLIIGLAPSNLSAQAQRVQIVRSSYTGQHSSQMFSQVPKLINSGATNQSLNASSTYHFTIAVPKNARDALKAVTITQRSGGEKIAFSIDQSRAVRGDTLARGSSIAITPTGGSEPQNANEVTLVFEQPVQPGNSVTLGLKVPKNPQYEGVYSFGVTAFPENEQSPSLYLGSADFEITGN